MRIITTRGEQLTENRNIGAGTIDTEVSRRRKEGNSSRSRRTAEIAVCGARKNISRLTVKGKHDVLQLVSCLTYAASNDRDVNQTNSNIHIRRDDLPRVIACGRRT